MVANTGKTLRTDRLRPLNLPQSVNVELDDKQLPTAITDERSRREVVRVVEVWRVDDEWWRNRIARRYVEVIVDNGARVTLFEDQTNGGWFEQVIGR